MHVGIIILMAVFQLLDSTMAAWDPDSPLMLVGLPSEPADFPSVVRTSERFECTVYFPAGFIGNQMMTYAYCPESEDDDEFCNYAEPFATSRYAQMERPRDTCDKPVEFDMIRKIDRSGTHESCAYYDKSGKYYSILFWKCAPEEEKLGSLVYEACYQETEKQILLAKYTIDQPNLLNNELLEEERLFLFAYDSFSYFEDFHDHFNLIVKHLYAQENIEYVKRSVLPHEWFPFAHQRKTAFYYMNVAPMHKRIRDGWENFMDNMRIRICQMDGIIKITAGLLDEFQDRNGATVYLGYSHITRTMEVPIPAVWWVLIQNKRRTHGVVLMMQNVPLRRSRAHLNQYYYDTQQCSLDICDRANILDSLPDTEDYPRNIIYCCKPHVITHRFGLNGSNNILVFPNA